MPKPYYADYVNHCLRFYFRYASTKGFKNEVDKLNYTATDKVIQKLKPTEQAIVRSVFVQDNFSIIENVSHSATLFHEDNKKIWSLVNYVTSKIAKERRLL